MDGHEQIVAEEGSRCFFMTDGTRSGSRMCH